MKVVMRMKMMAVMMGKATMMMQMVMKRRMMGMETMMMKIKTKTTMIVEMVVLIVMTKVLMVQSAL